VTEVALLIEESDPAVNNFVRLMKVDFGMVKLIIDKYFSLKEIINGFVGK
jgi:hypothetical protein